ncbi:MAG: hypothetical protein LOD94_04610, partial [Gammaproteobacteria bacterium]
MRSRSGNRLTACTTAALSAFLLASGLYSQQTLANESVLARMQGVWMPEPTPDELRTVDGKRPPLTDEAAAIYEERIALRKAGDTSFDRTTWCAGPGMPRILLMPYPFEIISSQDRVAFIHGWYRWFRVVDMAGDAEPDFFYPTTMGFSVGRWEGDTLVIRTVGLSDVTTLDAALTPAPAVVVVGDRNSQLTDFLRGNGVPAEEAGWEVVDDLDGLEVVVLNNPPTVDRDTFLAALAAFDAAGVSVIFPAVGFASSTRGVDLLIQHTGDPPAQNWIGTGGPAFFLENLADHPIFEGIEDPVQILV